MSQQLEEIRAIVAQVLELEPNEIADDDDFVKLHDADSMRAVEILARIEKKYRIEIPQNELPHMQTLACVYDVVARYAGWPE